MGLFALRKWITQDGNRALLGRNGKPVWQELKLDGVPGATRWAVEVVRPDGFVMRVAHDTPSALVEELLRARPC